MAPHDVDDLLKEKKFIQKGYIYAKDKKLFPKYFEKIFNKHKTVTGYNISHHIDFLAQKVKNDGEADLQIMHSSGERDLILSEHYLSVYEQFENALDGYGDVEFLDNFQGSGIIIVAVLNYYISYLPNYEDFQDLPLTNEFYIKYQLRHTFIGALLLYIYKNHLPPIERKKLNNNIDHVILEMAMDNGLDHILHIFPQLNTIFYLLSFFKEYNICIMNNIGHILYASKYNLESDDFIYLKFANNRFVPIYSMREFVEINTKRYKICFTCKKIHYKTKKCDLHYEEGGELDISNLENNHYCRLCRYRSFNYNR